MTGRKLTSTAAAGIIFAASCLAFGQNAATAAVKTGYAPVNGVIFITKSTAQESP